MAKPFSRKGVHKLECPACDGAMYATVAQLEARGLPQCWCGETLQPTTLDLAMILGADESRPMMAFMRERNSVAKGQMSHYARGRVLRGPDEVAAERVERERVQFACWRQLAALRPTPTVEAMPF